MPPPVSNKKPFDLKVLKQWAASARFKSVRFNETIVKYQFTWQDRLQIVLQYFELSYLFLFVYLCAALAQDLYEARRCLSYWNMQMDCPNLEFRAEIVSCCATSPSAQHNGIARANRTWNVAWRSMKHQVVSRLFTCLNAYAACSQEVIPPWRT